MSGGGGSATVVADAVAVAVAVAVADPVADGFALAGPAAVAFTGASVRLQAARKTPTQAIDALPALPALPALLALPAVRHILLARLAPTPRAGLVPRAPPR
jgi:hypothetical protein